MDHANTKEGVHSNGNGAVHNDTEGVPQSEGKLPTSTSPRIRSQLDILTALIPMMGKQRVGPHAKEAMLIALGIKDKRIDRFVIHETGLLLNVVSELARKFTQSVEAGANAVASVGGAVPSPFLATQGRAPSMWSPPTSNTNNATNYTNATDDTMTAKSSVGASKSISEESFLKVLKFCNAISVVASSYRPGEHLESPASSGTRKPEQSLQDHLLQCYREVFLSNCLRPSLAVNGEGHVLSAQGLLRRALIELGRGGPLAEATGGFLCSDKELLMAFVARAGSVSKAVAVSTIQLLSTILGAAPLEDAVALLFGAAPGMTAVTGKENKQKSTVPGGDNVADGASVFAEGLEETQPAKSTSLGVEESSEQSKTPQFDLNAASTSSTPSVAKASEVDSRLAQVCLALEKRGYVFQQIYESEAVPKKSDTETDPYTEAAARGIMFRLSGRLSVLVATVREQDGTSEELEDRNVWKNAPISGSGVETTESVEGGSKDRKKVGGALMDLLLRKLGLFLSLRLDEQLAVTGLVDKCICLLCAAIIAASGREHKDLDRLNCILSVLKIIESLWKELSGHMQKVTDCAAKLQAVKDQLAISSAISNDNEITKEELKAEQRRRRLLEKDGPQVKRMLETAVVVQEMLAEVKGALHATRCLRSGFEDVSTDCGAVWDDSLTDDEGVASDDDQAKSTEGGGFESSTVTEASFLTECEEVEQGLSMLCDGIYSGEEDTNSQCNSSLLDLSGTDDIDSTSHGDNGDSEILESVIA